MMTKVLMVCLGNICRSPLAEGILKSKINQKKITVDSAGTAGYHVGNKPDPRSIAVAKLNGIDISQQSCRKFSTQDFKNFDIIYVMDKSNYNNLISLAKNDEETKKVKLILSEVSLDIKEVPDPYYDADEGFTTVFNLINSACNNIAQKLNS